MNKKKTINAILRTLLGVVLVIAAWWLLRSRYESVQVLTPGMLRSYIRSYGDRAVVVYIGAYVLNTISVFPPITPLSVTSGLAFGPFWGALYLFIGALLGSNMAFFISRFFGRALVERSLKGRSRELDRKLEQNGFGTVLFFRLVPVIPYAVFNYCCGLSAIAFKDYFLATLVSLIPVVMINAFFGDVLAETTRPGDMLSPRFLIVVGVTALRLAGPILYRVVKRARRM